MLRKKVKAVQEIKTHILCSTKSPPPENRAVCDIMWGKKIGTAGQATCEGIILRRKDALCMPDA